MDDETQLDTLLSEGDLVFDVGANTGEKTRAFLERGVRVVCFEPQAESVEILARRFKDEPRVVLVPKGLAAEPGHAELRICTEGNVYSTMAAHWVEGRFQSNHWYRTELVETLTLDQAIETYGRPSHIKIDVEGFEESVIRGLHEAVGSVAFEFTREFLSDARRCLRWLESLGFSRFNAVLGEGDRFLLPKWSPPTRLFEHLARQVDPLLWGDIYAHAPMSLQSVQLRRPGELDAGLDEMLWRLRGRGVCHDVRVLYVIGAHRFQERHLLDELFPNLERIYLFDPLPEVQAVLRAIARQDPRVRVFAVAISNRDGTARFIRTDNRGMSSSLLRMKKHREHFPGVHEVEEIEVPTRTLDSLIREHALEAPDMLFMDVQGAEFEILESLPAALKATLHLIYTEASTDEVYESARALDEIRFMLAPHFVFLGFAPLSMETPTHGNALFVAAPVLDRVHRTPSAPG